MVFGFLPPALRPVNALTYALPSAPIVTLAGAEDDPGANIQPLFGLLMTKELIVELPDSLGGVTLVNFTDTVLAPVDCTAIV